MNGLLGTEYCHEEWNHGLRCMDCNRLLVDGDRYSERLSSFVDDAPLVEIICVGCALTPSNERSTRE